MLADSESAEGAPAVDDVKDLKAKLAKIKRQAITFKTKFTEAAAARDAALAKLDALKQASAAHCYDICNTKKHHASCIKLPEA